MAANDSKWTGIDVDVADVGGRDIPIIGTCAGSKRRLIASFCKRALYFDR